MSNSSADDEDNNNDSEVRTQQSHPPTQPALEPKVEAKVHSHLKPQPQSQATSQPPLGLNSYQDQPMPIRAVANRLTPMMGGQTVLIMLQGNQVGQRPNWQTLIREKWNFDYNQPPATYPFTRYLELVDFLKDQLYPTLEPDAAYQKLGYGACQCYFVGVGGQILKIAARVMGPQRGAQQFVRNMQRVLPWDTHELVDVRPGYFCYRKAYSGGSPAIMLGFMEASAEATGVTQKRLSYRFEGPPDDLKVSHEIEWNT